MLQTVILLSLMVIIHELGHYWMARLFGVHVLEFSIGFGPVLAKTTRKGTQYSLRVVPLGGYVKLAGMDLVVEGEPGTVAADDPASLRQKSAWKKALIILAGPLNNLILAAFTLTLMLATVGVPKGADKRSVIGNIEPKTPGYEAGFSAGDRVIAVNDKPIALWSELVDSVRGTGGKPVTLTVVRAERILTRTMKPFYDPELKVFRLGIYPRYIFQRLSVGRSIEQGIKGIYWASVGIVQMLVRGLRGKARVSLSGPVGVIGAVGQSVKAGPWWFLQLVASISLFLALFNLLPVPLPLLDGGWVVIYLLEGLRRREFSAEQKAAAQILGLIVIVSFFLIVTYGDLLTGIRRFLNR